MLTAMDDDGSGVRVHDATTKIAIANRSFAERKMRREPERNSVLAVIMMCQVQ